MAEDGDEKTFSEQTRDAINSWRRGGGYELPIAQLALIAKASRPTVMKWTTGDAVPGVNHIRRLEAFKPGLVAALFPAS